MPVIGLLLVGAAAVWSLAQLSPKAVAQEGPSQTCRVSVIIDRSGSVGNNMPTLKEQIRRLFQPTGVYDDKIEIAFWSFSHVITGGFGQPSNYNAPFHGYVSSRGENSGFMSALSSVQPAGNTNYQQAFAYNGTTRNPALNDIIEPNDILVFLTDGQPNSVNQNGVSPENAGRIAAQKHMDAGRVVIGGSIGANAAQVRVINYVVSNDANNYNNTFTVSTNYNDLAIKLKAQIGTKCNQLFPPEPCPYNASLPKDDPNCVPPQPAYTLKPLVTVDNVVISSDESAGFQYRITNESATTTTPAVGWSIKQVVVDKGQSADPLYYGTETYKDDFNCSKLLALISNRGDCEDNIASGTKAFAPGVNVLTSAEVGSASRLVVDDKWPVGTKVCYVLVATKPTEKSTPVDRHSRAACVVIGKRPSVQVHGGDLSVGGLIPGDTEPASPVASKIHTGITIKGGSVDGVFGSWVEYGAFAPGGIIGLGTASGLKHGYHPATAGSQQNLWSKLTFGNVGDEFGAFAETRTIPDIASALLRSSQTPTQIAPEVSEFNAGTMNSGIYERQNGDLRLAGSTLGKGKSVIVYVPNGTVTIAGNQSYTDEALSSLNDIPRLVIIARNINIHGGVGVVDAWLIARNSVNGTGGGIVNTCSDGPARLTINDCSQQLRINGLVIARNLLLKRTSGAASGSNETNDQPAEIINLRADSYLSALARRTDITLPITTYSVELPPRF